MKKINIIYWVFTGLLAALMLSSAIPSIINGPVTVKFMAHLGYPAYLSPFLGVAKLLGILALFVPGFPRIREWAYAGFTFDLIGALYSFIKVGDPVSQWAMFAIFFIILAGSYIFWHRRLNASAFKDTAL